MLQRFATLERKTATLKLISDLLDQNFVIPYLVVSLGLAASELVQDIISILRGVTDDAAQIGCRVHRHCEQNVKPESFAQHGQARLAQCNGTGVSDSGVLRNVALGTQLLLRRSVHNMHG